MAREKELFRKNLELINEQFPKKASLNYAEICALFGYSRRTAIRHWKKFYNRTVGGVPVTTVAREMCS